jgi:long-chain fatty acid transport protein
MPILSRNGQKLGVGTIALLGVSAAAITTAHAGGFAVREQSAYYQGMSFAGAAAGNELSSMFWNSAAAAAAPGMNSETHIALIIGDSEITATDSLTVGPFTYGAQSGGISDPAVVPASYGNYQISDRLFLGIAINSPAGLTTKPDDTSWVGSFLAHKAKIFTANANPTLAYKLTDTLTVGAGVQVQYTQFKFDRNITATLQKGSIDTDDYGVGFTAGIIWQPLPYTQIGLGYRSGISTKLEGDTTIPTAGGFVTLDTEANEFDSPDLLTLSIRQGITDRLTAYGTVEWQKWSNLETLTFDSGLDAANPSFELNWDDGWFFAFGLEYAYTPDWTVRAGIAYELSPIDETRSVFLPDNDRLWLSAGATHKLTENATIDLAYTHIFVKDAPISRDGLVVTGPASAVAFTLDAEAETSVDIISASFKYKWGGGERELEPLK